MIWQAFGRAEMNLIGSRESTHCPLWFSWTEGGGPLGQDSLGHEWPDASLFPFPPLPLILPMFQWVLQQGHWPCSGRGGFGFHCCGGFVVACHGVSHRGAIFSCTWQAEFGAPTPAVYNFGPGRCRAGLSGSVGAPASRGCGKGVVPIRVLATYIDATPTM